MKSFPSRFLPAFLLSILLAACQGTEEPTAVPPSRGISARVVRNASISPGLWERTVSIRVAFYTSDGWALLDQTFPFGTQRSASVSAPVDQAVRIVVQGFDSLGTMMWSGEKLAPASSSGQSFDVHAEIVLSQPDPSGDYIGRAESVRFLGTYTSSDSSKVSIPANGLVLKSPTAAAEIHYTIDGSIPSSESPQYHAPLLAIPPGTRLRAAAFAPRMMPSEPRSVWISAPPFASISVSSLAGDVGYVRITSNKDTIRYTTDGSEPIWSSPIAPASLFIGRDMILRTSAFQGLDVVATRIDTFRIKHVITFLEVDLSRSANDNFWTEKVLWARGLNGTSIHYRRDGREPGSSDSILPVLSSLDSSGWRLASGMALRAWRTDLGWSPTAIANVSVGDRTLITTNLVYQEQGDLLYVGSGPAGWSSRIPDTVLITWALGDTLPTFDSRVLPKSFQLNTLNLAQGATATIRVSAWHKPSQRHLFDQVISYQNNHGTWTDPRDARTYRTLLNPQGELIFSQDLAFDTLDQVGSWMPDGASGRTYARSLVADTTPCLSPWSGDCRALPSPNDPCPDGWRLPNLLEWQRALDVPWFKGSLGIGWTNAGKFSGDKPVYWSEEVYPLWLGATWNNGSQLWQDALPDDAYRVRCIATPSSAGP